MKRMDEGGKRAKGIFGGDGLIEQGCNLIQVFLR